MDKYSQFENLYKEGRMEGPGIWFELYSRKTKDRLSGNVTGEYEKEFVGSIDQLPVVCANATAFGALIDLLDGTRAHFRIQTRPDHLGARIRASLNNGDDVRFLLRSANLPYYIRQEAGLSGKGKQ